MRHLPKLLALCTSLSMVCHGEVCDEPQGITGKRLDEGRDVAVLPILSEELNITEMLDIAFRHNPETYRAWSNVRSGVYLYRVSRAPLFPTIRSDTTANIVDQQYHLSRSAAGLSNASNGTVRSLEEDLILSYLLLDFGGRQANIKAAGNAALSLSFLYDRTLQTVFLDVLQSYYRYQSTKSALEAKLDDVKDAEKNLEAAEALYKAGVKTRIDTLQAKATLANQMLDLTVLNGQLKIDLGTLATAMGIPVSSPIKIADIPSEINVKKALEDVDLLIEKAKLNRPDLAAVYADLQQRRAEVTVAKSEGMPTLNFLGDLNRTLYSGGPIKSSHAYTGAVVLSIPIYNGNLYWNKEKNAIERVNAALADTEIKKAQVALEVFTSYYTFLTAADAIGYSEESLKYAQEAYNQIFASYKQGVLSILDVITSQAILSNARSSVIKAKSEWLIALTNIAYTTGRSLLCEDLPGKTP